MGLMIGTLHHSQLYIVTFPLTKDLAEDFGMSHRSTAYGVREALFMSWSRAPRVVETGAMVIFPLTPVDTRAFGSPTGTSALLLQHKSKFPLISTAFSLRYFSCAAQKCLSGCWTHSCHLCILYCTGMREVKFSAEWAYRFRGMNCNLTRLFT